MHKWPDLREILAGIAWVVVGGVATRAFMPERMTKDLDILVRKQDVTAVLQKLRAAEYKVESELSIGGYQIQSPQGVEVDLLAGEQSWLDEALSVPVTDPAGFPVLALPYLVLLKLEASRTQDLADIAQMLGWADEAQLAHVRAVVDQYAPADRDDVESLIYLGQQERRSKN